MVNKKAEQHREYDVIVVGAGMVGAAFAGGHAADDVGAVIDHLACMKGAFASCEALHNHF